MKIIHILLFLYFAISLSSQSLDDWTWFELEICDERITSLVTDNNGHVWFTCGDNFIKYDGQEFHYYDTFGSGVPVWSIHETLIDASLEGIIWMTSEDQVMRYEITTASWTVFDPFPQLGFFDFNDIHVISDDDVWVSTARGVWVWDGTDWDSHEIFAPAVLPDVKIPKIIDTDSENNKWITTAAAFINGGILITPGGVVRISETDSTYFNGETIGLPNGGTPYIDVDSNDDLVYVSADLDSGDVFLTHYKNESWMTPERIPFEGKLKNMKLGSEDQIYFLFEEFIAVKNESIWDVIPIDTSKIDFFSSFLINANDEVYLSGYQGSFDFSTQGVLGLIPKSEFRATGTIYSDLNLNDVFDEGDRTVRNLVIQTVEEDRFTFSNLDGEYSMLFSQEGAYEIKTMLPKYHSFRNPIDGVNDVSVSVDNSTNTGLDFGFETDTSIIDLLVSITPLNPANVGFGNCYSIDYKNVGPKITGGLLIAEFDDILNFTSSSDENYSIDGNKLTYIIQDLELFESDRIKLCFSIPININLLGDTMKHQVMIESSDGEDIFMKNNIDSLCHVITGPFDPNYIAVRPNGIGESGNIPLSTQTLEYTVHFQNIGTDTARNVFIDNPIDVNLDLTSLNVLAASHEYNMRYVEDERMLVWDFNNINLPDSTANELESNGFIKYTVDLKNVEVGQSYLNQADIFFDFNPPITTNTTINTIYEDPNSTKNWEEKAACDFICTNLNGEFIIHFSEIDVYEVLLYNFNGQLLHSSIHHHNEARINIKNASKGPFVVFVKSKDCPGKGSMIVNFR